MNLKFEFSIKIVAIFLTIVAIVLLQFKKQEADYIFAINSFVSKSTKPLFQEITLNTDQPYNHASSVAVLNPTMAKAIVAWVAGKKELGSNVNIYVAEINYKNNLQQQKFRSVMDVATLEQAEHRYIHSIGNPIVVYYANKLWLFFVSTFGGWSASSINYMTSTDAGKTWSSPRMLILSPIFNISKGLKGTPLVFKNGMLGLPIYTEFADHDGELVWMSSNAQIRAVARLSNNGHALQPVIVPLTGKKAFVFMRQHHAAQPRIQINATLDGGASWPQLRASELRNPDAAVTAIRTENDQVLLAFNDSADDRHDLTFAILDGKSKPKCFIPFEDDDKGNFAYPYIVYQAPFYLMSYSDNGKISLLKFNQAWINQKWKQCTKQ